MEFEISYDGLGDDEYKELAMDLLAAQFPKRYSKTSYRALFVRYILATVAAVVMLGVLVFSLVFGMSSSSVLMWSALALTVVIVVLLRLNARKFVTARATWKSLKKVLSGRDAVRVLLNEEGIHVTREDGQKRIFLGWSVLTTGVKSANFVVLMQGGQMYWALPKRCIAGRIPEFKAILEKYYYSQGKALVEKR